MDKQIPTVDELLDTIDLSFSNYTPSADALHFWNTMQLIKGPKFFTAGIPMLHYYFIDLAFNNVSREAFPYSDDVKDRIKIKRNKLAILCSRGLSKSTTFSSFLVIYMAMFGRLPGLKRPGIGDKVNFVVGVGDSQEGGAKVMCNTLRDMIEESELLQKYFEKIRCTDAEIELVRAGDEPVNERSFMFRAKGAQALPLDTKLYTETGYTTIGDVQVGDSIYGADGFLAEVTRKSEIFHEDVYRINLRDGRSLDVSENHINSVLYKTRGTDGTRIEEMDLTTLELLEKPLYYSSKGYGKYSEETYTTARMFIKNIGAIQYPEKELEIDPYTLGLILGDGTVMETSKRVSLTSHVDDWTEYRDNIPYSLEVAYEKENTLTYVVEGVGESMRKLGLNVDGCDKFIPEEYFTASVPQRLSLLQGLIDSDGHIRQGRRGFGYATTSTRLAGDVCRLVRSLGGIAKIVTPDEGEDRNFPLQRVHCKLNMDVARLRRKAERIDYTTDANMVEVTSIEKIEMVPTQCIAINNEDKQFIAGEYVRTHNSGIRGQRYKGERIDVIIGDDLVKTEADSRSDTIMKNIRSTIYSDAIHALRAQGGMEILIGTPFNKNDIVYSAIEGGWTPLVVPICEKVSKDLDSAEFKGAWPEMHTYERVMSRYEDMVDAGESRAFNQELMLRISSEEDKLVKEDQIQWYSRKSIEKNLGGYNIYTTSDLTASNDLRGDFSCVMTWAVNSQGDWFMLDASVRKQTIDEQYKPILSQVRRWGARFDRNVHVGVEIDGQQQLNVYALKKLMVEYNTFFTFARQIGSAYGKEGISRRQATGAKHEQFMRVHPLFQQKKMFFPEEMKGTEDMKEILNELNYITYEGITSKHDDALDCISMIAAMEVMLPSQDQMIEAVKSMDKSVYYPEPEDDNDDRCSVVF